MGRPISGAVALADRLPVDEGLLIDLATVKRGRRSWAGVFAYLARSALSVTDRHAASRDNIVEPGTMRGER